MGAESVPWVWRQAVPQPLCSLVSSSALGSREGFPEVGPFSLDRYREVLRAGRGWKWYFIDSLFIHELTVTHLMRVVLAERWRDED